MQARPRATLPGSWGWRWCAVLAALCCPPPPADARPAREAAARIDIAGQALAGALDELSRQAAVSIGSAEPLPAIRAPAVHRARSVEDALARLLAGSGYAAQQAGPTAWRIVRQREPAVAPARLAAPPPATESPAILVTATKHREPLRDLPRAIAVLALTGADGVPTRGTAAVAADVEGLTLTALGPGRNRMFLRGVADSPFNGASQSTVAVLVDDTRLTYSAPDPDLRLVDVERVELLKGPQGSLYGTGALGGIYRVVTNRADPDRLAGMISAGLQPVEQGGLGRSGSAMVNLPLLPGTAALRLVGYAETQPGWIDTGPRDDSNSSRIVGGRGNLGIATDGWRIDLSGLFQRIDAADSQYAYVAGARTRPAQLAEPHDNDLNQVSARAEGRIGTVEAVIVTGNSWHEVRDTLDATIGAGSFGLADPQLFHDFRQYRVWDSEARFAGQVGRIRWLAGLSHVSASDHEQRSLAPAPPAAAMPIDDSHREDSDTGLFVQLSLPLTRTIALETGGRLYRSVLEAQRTVSGAQTAETTRKSGFTPAAAIAWRPREGRLLWLRYGSAFRQGGLDFEADGKVHPFAGDELATVEAGWREQIAGGGQFDAGVSLTWWDDMQSDLLLANGLVQTGNAGQARILAGEASLTLPLRRGWTVDLGATVQSALLVKNRLGIALDDRRLPTIPDYSLRGGVRHGFRLWRASGSLGLGLRYIGPARLSFDPQLDRPMGRVLDSRVDGTLDWGRTRLSVRFDNLLNHASDLFAYGNPFRIATPQFTPQPPFSTTFSLSRRF